MNKDGVERKVNASQIKRYREQLNIERTGNTKRDSPCNLRVRECTAHSKETPIPTRLDDSATLKNMRKQEQSQNEPPSQRVKK